MMAEQPSFDTGKDLLFLLTGGWDNDSGEAVFCPDVAYIDGAMQMNPHWADAVTIVRVDPPRPRAYIVDLLDEANQNAPTLILADGAEAHEAVETVNGRRFITDPRAICAQLAAAYGGSKPSF